MTTSRRAARIISVGGGKGGVGKSLVAGNLGVAMAQEGARVILVDADLGAANQHTLFGVDRPGPTIHGLFERSISTLDQAVIPSGVPNLDLIPGSSGAVGAADLSPDQKAQLIQEICALPAEVVIIDVGAGVSFTVLDLFDLGELRLAVLTPQLTSLQNAYAFLKGAVFRELRRVAQTSAQVALVEESPEAGQPMRRMKDLLERAEKEDPEFCGRLRAALGGFGARLIGNQIFDPKEKAALFAVSRMLDDFLGIQAPVLGCLRSTRALHDSVRLRRPFLLDAASEESASVLREIGKALLRESVDELRNARAAVRAVEVAPAAPEEPQGPELQEVLTSYQRSQDRVPIRCEATLVFAGGAVPVQILDVSEGGALVDIDRPPPAEARAVLVVSAIEDRPSLPCLVRHVSPEKKRAGVEFMGEKELVQRVVAELQRRYRSAEPA